MADIFGGRSRGEVIAKGQAVGIVGHCPQCGAPIYGKEWTNEEQPVVRYSCGCKAVRAMATMTPGWECFYCHRRLVGPNDICDCHKKGQPSLGQTKEGSSLEM